MSDAPVVLINSGAYIAPELSAEFGRLPPSFLPVGLQRLYELQAAALAPLGGELVLTLPESMEAPAWDGARLDELGVGVMRTPDDLELGAALALTLAQLGYANRPLCMMHGDTLVTGVQGEVRDGVSVASGGDGYRWAHVATRGERVLEILGPEAEARLPAGLRLSGYYVFSSIRELARTLSLAGGDFIEALNIYAAEQGLEAIATDTWLDFGHVQTYFRSRRIVTTARAFNQLEITETAVRKRSAQSDKLRAEAAWLRSVPAAMRPYTARLLDEGEDAEGFFYDTEYRSTPTLSELWVFGALPLTSWRRIFSACSTFLDLSTACLPQDTISDAGLGTLVICKTVERLRRYAEESGIELRAPNLLNGQDAPSLWECLEKIESVLSGKPDRPSVMHGDFCFSNILYDFRTDRIQVIDPRGLSGSGEPRLGGDVRYDAAKFMHSAKGRYDLIMAGRYTGGQAGANTYELDFPASSVRLDLEEAASALSMGGVELGSPEVDAITASLFLSMLPLHADRPDRQGAFVANALRLVLLGGEHW